MGLVQYALEQGQELRRLERLGWSVAQVWSAAAFLDPQGEADAIQRTVLARVAARARLARPAGATMPAGGVPAGAKNPYQVEMSNPGSPASAIVGSSGTKPERWAVVTASAFNLPALTCDIPEVAEPNIICTWLASRPMAAGPVPL